MSELKPCPLCAESASVTERDFPPLGKRYGVACDVCECGCDFRARSREIAIARWNTRLTTPSEPARLPMGEHNLPWAYRPHEFDDWGFIRDATGDLAACARGDKGVRSHDGHRVAGTDPYGEYAAFIVKAVNNHDALVKALEFIADGYDNHDVNHVDYRVKVYQVALDALASCENVECG